MQRSLIRRLLATATPRRPPPHLSPAKDPNTIQEALLPLPEALHLIKAQNTGHPRRSLALNLLCKSTDGSVRDIRGAAILPHRFTDTTRVCVLADDPAVQKLAREHGASSVGGSEMVDMIARDEVPMDRLIVTPGILPLLTPLARILGPRGIMPTVKKGTVTEDVVGALERQADAVLFKCDHNGLISAVIGRCGMDGRELHENIVELVRCVKANKKGKKARFVTAMWVAAPSDSSEVAAGVVKDCEGGDHVTQVAQDDPDRIYADKSEFQI